MSSSSRVRPETFSPADAHAQRAQLALVARQIDPNTAQFQEEAETEWKQALALEPGNVAALRLTRFLDEVLPRSEVVARLHRQTERRADDGEAWLLLGTLLDEPATGSGSPKRDSLRPVCAH